MRFIGDDGLTAKVSLWTRRPSADGRSTKVSIGAFPGFTAVGDIKSAMDEEKV
jgi:hypothetical protein